MPYAERYKVLAVIPSDETFIFAATFVAEYLISNPLGFFVGKGYGVTSRACQHTGERDQDHAQ
jgi:hypothetical protein